MRNITLGDEVFSLVVIPGFSRQLVMAFVLILDRSICQACVAEHDGHHKRWDNLDYKCCNMLRTSLSIYLFLLPMEDEFDTKHNAKVKNGSNILGFLQNWPIHLKQKSCLRSTSSHCQISSHCVSGIKAEKFSSNFKFIRHRETSAVNDHIFWLLFRKLNCVADLE